MSESFLPPSPYPLYVWRWDERDSDYVIETYDVPRRPLPPEDQARWQNWLGIVKGAVKPIELPLPGKGHAVAHEFGSEQR